MAVILPNTTFTVRKRAHPFGRDAHGLPKTTSTLGPPEGPTDGAVVEPDDKDPVLANQYRLRVDIVHWPLRPKDEVKDADGNEYVVRTARKVTVPADDAVDFIRVSADLREPEVP